MRRHVAESFRVPLMHGILQLLEVTPPLWKGDIDCFFFVCHCIVCGLIEPGGELNRLYDHPGLRHCVTSDCLWLPRCKHRIYSLCPCAFVFRLFPAEASKEVLTKYAIP